VRNPRKRPLEELAPYLLPDQPRPEGSAPQPPLPIDWAELFGNDRPVEIEVGFGKGMFLVRAAAARPDVNFFGIEVVRKYQLFAANRVAARSLSNVRLAWADARLMLRDRVPAESVQTVHVYFPDPWWKTRHHKRRVFTAEFAATVLRVLRPGGQLSIATDVEAYFTVMKATVAELPAFEPLPPPEPTAGADDLDYLTNFERKFRKQGLPIYRALYEKQRTG
jgi:tRNA (guanine-N7-)-methyltransferase